MARPLLPPVVLPASSRAETLTRVLLRTFAGRALVAGSVVKVVVLIARAFGAGGGLLQLLDRIGGIAIVIGGGYFLYKLGSLAQRRLLWRVRRKLILSYIFIGVVPALLIVAFFVLSGLLLFFNVASYLVASRLSNLAEQAEFQARTAAMEIQRLAAVEPLRAVLERKQVNLAPKFPGASLAAIPITGRSCDSTSSARAPKVNGAVVAVGDWPHVNPPSQLPEWIGCDGFVGVIAWTAPSDASTRARTSAPASTEQSETTILDTEPTHLAIRAVTLPDVAAPTFAVVVDLPINDTVVDRVYAETGIQIEDSSVALKVGQKNALPLIGRPLTAKNAAVAAISKGQAPGVVQPPLRWVSWFKFTDWNTGETGQASAVIALNLADTYQRLLPQLPGKGDFGQFILVVLALVAVLFLVIEGVALFMGLALARSITGSVHELFTGTERVRHGDFSHKIRIDAHDQLGELADSFNSMTASIEELLRQAAEKKRLEEELRIARDIQMSLLPQGPLMAPGLSVTALCVPAREVGGDYYDFFPLDDGRLGVLIADVSGKGTSAALYMAELKGLMLSLSKLYASPRELMIQANRIIADNLDARSFITMTYAVIDRGARTMTYARAGHTPLIHLPPQTVPREARILLPDGLVLGLKIDNGEMFEKLLEEAVIPLTSGDLFVLFTDGISESMNEASDCFGESRLGKLIEEHGDMPFDQLRERILREIEAFVGGAAQHDDMTMILIKVDDVGAAREEAAAMVVQA